MQSVQRVDARNLPCPMPILRLAVAMSSMQVGETVRLLATDEAVEADVTAWCGTTGHKLLQWGWDGSTFWADVQKS